MFLNDEKHIDCNTALRLGLVFSLAYLKPQSSVITSRPV